MRLVQLVTLLQKNALLAKSRVTGTVIEIVFPLVMSGIFVAVWAILTQPLGEQGFGPTLTVPGVLSAFKNYSVLSSGCNKSLLALNTTTSDLTYVVKPAHDQSTPAAACAADESCAALLVCHNDTGTGFYNYSIRMRPCAQTDKKYWANLKYPFCLPPTNVLRYDVVRLSSDPYVRSGFVSLQAALDSATAGLSGGMQADFPGSTVQPYTALGSKRTGALQQKNFLRSMYPYLFSPLFSTTCVLGGFSLAAALAYEKENKLAETMRMMGLSELAYTLSWALWPVAVGIGPVLANAAIAQSVVLPHVAYGDIAFLHIAFLLSTISLVHLLGHAFKRADSASIGTGFVLLAGVLGAAFAVAMFDPLANWGDARREALSLVAPFAWAFGNSKLAACELAALELAMGSNFTKDARRPCDVSNEAGFCLIDMLWHAVLALYLSQVLPGEHGSAKPWHFCLGALGQRWFGGAANPAFDTKPEPAHSGAVADCVEALREGTAGEGGIQVKGLVKVYGTKRVVDGLSFAANAGEMLSLLGHNGAGKSTTINMLTGLTPPSGGDATVNAHSITHSIGAVRRSLGVCPQHDVLWPQLSVRFTLRLYGVLKGVPLRSLPAAVEGMLKAVGLQHKANFPTSTLSGGQKRRLSVALAFIGGSSTVVLDEPTSGVDVFSRRELWQLIQDMRATGGTLGDGRRTVLLVTHFLEEADMLSDRIAIMSRGKLRASGTAEALKRAFGIGYTVVVTRAREGACDAKRQLLPLLRRHVPDDPGYGDGAEIVSDHGQEVAVQLPARAVGTFPSLFADLDRAMDSIGIAEYGVSMTSLQDVFLRLAAEAREGAVSNTLSASFGSDRSSRSESTGSLHESNLDLGQSLEQRSARRRQRSLSDASAAVLRNVRAGTAAGAAPRQIGALVRLQLSALARAPRVLLTQVATTLVFVAVAALIVNGVGYTRPGCDLPNAAVFPPLPLSGAALPTLLQGNLGAGVRASGNFGIQSGNGGFNETELQRFAQQMPRTSLRPRNGSCVEVVDTVRGNSEMFQGAFCQAASQPATVWLATATHLLPALANVRHNALQLQPPNITTYAHPFDAPPIYGDQGSNINALIYGTLVLSIVLPLVPAVLATQHAKERESGVLQQVKLSGVSPLTYWSACFLHDTLWLALTVALSLVVWAGFGGAASALLFTDSSTCAMSVLLFLLAMIDTTATVNVIAARAKEPSRVFGSAWGSQFAVVFIFIAAAANIVIQTPNPFFIVLVVTIVFGAASPSCMLVVGIWMQGNLAYIRCSGEQAVSATSFRGTGVFIFFMALHTIIMFTIIIAREVTASGGSALGSLCDWCCPARGAKVGGAADAGAGDAASEDNEGEDEDVKALRRAVLSSPPAEQSTKPLLHVAGLRKEYPPSAAHGGRAKVAVHNLSLQVARGECLCLLGPNGAGKTTFFGSLTGRLTPTAGTVTVAGFDLAAQLAQVHRSIGFVPQFDALIAEVSARANLALHARLRGIPEGSVPALIDRLFEQLGLTPFQHTPAGGLSGGNRRKLSLAIALVGAPPVLLLDEPSTGMDPEARRFMWDAITALRSDHAIVLTTHSMEEADALATHVSIMVDGVMQCHGTPQRIKSVYSKGYHLSMRAPPPSDAKRAAGAGTVASSQSEANGEITARVQRLFPGACVEESYGSAMAYKVPPSFSIARVFGAVLPLAQELGVSDCVVSQDTLEQIFLTFASKQDETATMKRAARVEHLRPCSLGAGLGNALTFITCFWTLTLAFSVLCLLWFSLVALPIARTFSKHVLRLNWWAATAFQRDLSGTTEKYPCRHPRLMNALWMPFGIALAICYWCQSAFCLSLFITFPLAQKHHQMALLSLRRPFVGEREVDMPLIASGTRSGSDGWCSSLCQCWPGSGSGAGDSRDNGPSRAGGLESGTADVVVNPAYKDEGGSGSD